MSLLLTQIDQDKNINRPFDVLKIKVGAATIFIKEQQGKLLVFGDDSDLMVQPHTTNSFSVVTAPAFSDPDDAQ